MDEIISTLEQRRIDEANATIDWTIDKMEFSFKKKAYYDEQLNWFVIKK
jgi:hypothetical protein